MAGCENEFGGKNAIGESKRMTFETMSLIANRGERRASHGCARHQPENDQLLIPAVAARVGHPFGRQFLPVIVLEVAHMIKLLQSPKTFKFLLNI